MTLLSPLERAHARIVNAMGERDFDTVRKEIAAGRAVRSGLAALVLACNEHWKRLEHRLDRIEAVVRTRNGLQVCDSRCRVRSDVHPRGDDERTRTKIRSEGFSLRRETEEG